MAADHVAVVVAVLVVELAAVALDGTNLKRSTEDGLSVAANSVG